MTSSPARRPTPRPNPTDPTVIRRADAAHHVWGDPEGGLVTDRVLVSTDQLHVLEFELPGGTGFRHTATNPTLFAADVAYMCVAGTLVLADPSTGEVQVAPAGSGVFYGRDTWHHGFALGRETVRVVEFMSPPPSRGTASTYGRTRPLLTPEQVRYRDERWAGRWPQAAGEQRASRRLHLLEDERALLSFRDDSPTHLVHTLLDTEHLLVERGTVAPGTVDPYRRIDRDTVVRVEDGELWVDVRRSATVDGNPEYFVQSLRDGDACFVPAGAELRTLVRADRPARYLRGSGTVPDGWAP